MRTITRSLATLAVTAAITTLPAPASADAWFEPTPTVAYPLTTDTDGVARIVLSGPKNVYGLRHFARDLDNKLPGLEVTFADASACEADTDGFDSGPTCVRVVPGHFGGPESTTWAGLAHINSDGTQFTLGVRTIEINLDMTDTASRPVRYRRYVIRHEFLHILGLLHHGEPRGLVSTNKSNAFRGLLTPSTNELASLQSVYGD